MDINTEEDSGLSDSPKQSTESNFLSHPSSNGDGVSTSPILTASPNTSTSRNTPANSQQLGQCVYVATPWRRGRSVFTTSQPSPTGNPLLQCPQPYPVGVLRYAPYRPYCPPGPHRPPPGNVHRDFSQDYRYVNDYYNAYPSGPPDFATYSGQEHVQSPEDTTAPPNFEQLYSTAYPTQVQMYSPYQQPCWNHTAPAMAYTDPTDENQTLTYYPDHVTKISTSTDFVAEDSSGVPGSVANNVPRKGVRVKFMGPEAMYLTTKTLEMQAGHAMEALRTNQHVVNVSSNGNVQIYNNTRAEAPCSDHGLAMSEVIVQTSSDLEANQDDSQERVTFDSIEDALASIDRSPMDEAVSVPPLADKTVLQVSSVSYQGLRMADEKQEEVIKAAKSLFSKRTRTLYHWLYPQTSKTKLKATVSAAWDTLAEMEKQFYVSQVLGRFGLQASSLMINPQLDGIKGMPTEVACSSTSSAERVARPLPPMPPMPAMQPGRLNTAIEAQQAVDQLFASCADSEHWTSYCGGVGASPCTVVPSPTLTAASLASASTMLSVNSSRSSRSRSGHCGGSQSQSDRRKRTFPKTTGTGGRARLGSLLSDQLDEEVSILKRMREAKLEAEMEEDSDLTSEIDRFRLATQDGDRSAISRDGDDFWRRTPDPEDLFTHLDF